MSFKMLIQKQGVREIPYRVGEREGGMETGRDRGRKPIEVKMQQSLRPVQDTWCPGRQADRRTDRQNNREENASVLEEGRGQPCRA